MKSGDPEVRRVPTPASRPTDRHFSVQLVTHATINCTCKPSWLHEIRRFTAPMICVYASFNSRLRIVRQMRGNTTQDRFALTGYV
jgi:hypothetical protein